MAHNIKDIFAPRKRWRNIQTQEEITLNSMSSWGYDSKGPGSIQIRYPDDLSLLARGYSYDRLFAEYPRLRSVLPEEFFDFFEEIKA